MTGSWARIVGAQPGNPAQLASMALDCPSPWTAESDRVDESKNAPSVVPLRNTKSEEESRSKTGTTMIVALTSSDEDKSREPEEDHRALL